MIKYKALLNVYGEGLVQEFCMAENEESAKEVIHNMWIMSSIEILKIEVNN